MSRRSGFTFIELIAAMVAGGVLMASLLATVFVATSLLEPSETLAQQQSDRDIADRISADLRYASAVDTTTSNGFQITRPNVTSGTSESVYYESYMDGLTRQVAGGVTVQLDATAPSTQFHVDGYSGASTPSPTSYPRVRSLSSTHQLVL